METPRDISAYTLRLPKELYERIKADASEAGQTLVVWFTRAALARLDNKQGRDDRK